MYAVLGANGRAGGETAHALIGMGKAVRVVLRRPEQAAKWTGLGAEIAIADIDDVDSMAAALKGVDGAFLLSPPPVGGDPFQRADEVGSALAKAVRKAGVQKVVALSSVGAQHEDGTGVIATLNRIEKHLDGAAPSTTFLRPGYFVETWSEVAPVASAEGVLPSFLEPSQKIPMVSTMDVGLAAAELLCDDASDGRHVVELRGPQDWSADDVAQAFSRALERPVATAFVPPEARAPMLAEQGVPEEVATALLGMYDGIASGRVEHEATSERRRGSISLDHAVSRIVREM